MKIVFNPSNSSKNVLDLIKNNKDIIFDLKGHSIYARGVEFKGTDTNTWRDIKVNNVSIGSHTLDLRNGSNTTLTNTNGVVIINSTWRPVVDNLTSNSTTSSLSANQGKVLKALIDSKSNSGHTHDDRYLKLTGGTMLLGEGLKFHSNDNYFGTDADARIISLLDNNDKICDGGLIIDERATLDGKEYVTELLRIRDSEFKWRGADILHSGNYSGILDARYYTESEVNSLLSKKLDRVNLTTGSWNPRGYHLAADYNYNGGDLSISENSGQIHVSIGGYFWQNEGKYRVLDTSDVAGLKGDLTVRQYLSATDFTWWPLIWGGSSHVNTNDSAGAVYKSYNKLSWQTSTQTLYATNIRTENIKRLSIGGGIYWNLNVESASDSSEASITLVKSGVAGGTTLVLSQMNDANDTIQFKTNAAAKLYHNSYPILTTQNTYVSNNKGYINGTEITQVNNADKVDNRHAISTIPNTGIIYKAAIYTDYSLTSYWVRLASIPSINQHNEFVATIHVQSGHSRPGRSATLLVYLRGAASILSKSFKICCNSNYDPNRFRLYYKDGDKTSEIWYQTTGQFDGIITTVISQSSEGTLYEGLTLYSGSITAVQTPSMSTYVSAQVSTITDNISGNASTATKLATPRNIWGQSFDGTADVDNTLRIRKTTGNYCEGIRIQTADGAWSTIILGATADSGTNTNAWSIHRKSDNNFSISRNSSDGLNGLVMTSIGMGLGTTAPTQRLDVAGNIRATGQLYLPINGNYNAILMGDDCWMGDCNIDNVIGLSGTGNANAGGIKFGKGGMHIGYNGSNHYSSDTSLWSNFNADLLDGVHVNQLCRIYTFKVHDEIIKVGTLTSGQYGHVCKLRFNSGIGYNASNQDKAMTVVIRASNGNANSKGFYFEAHSESYRAGAFTTFYLHQTSKTQCELYMAAFNFSGQSTYEVSFSAGDSWVNEISHQNALPTSSIFTLPNYQIAYSDYNIASATKLATARNIWGQSFDGTRDVNGTIYINNGNSENGAIILNNNVNTHARISAIGDQVVFNTGSALRFGGTEWEYSDWAGLKYDTVANTIYLGIADGTVFNYYSNKRSNGTLKLPGISNINLDGSARIGYGSVGLYIGNPGNDGWIYTQDIASQLGTSSWNIRQSGAARFGKIHIASKNNESANDNVIESDTDVSLHLNYYNNGNITLCNGGGSVGIGPMTDNKYRLNVNGNMIATGFHYKYHDNNDAVLLAGGGYSILSNLIFGNSYNYKSANEYNLLFYKLGGIFNNLVWVDGHVYSSTSVSFAINKNVFPYGYDNNPDLETRYGMGGDDYISVNAIGIVKIACNESHRVGFFYTGIA